MIGSKRFGLFLVLALLLTAAAPLQASAQAAPAPAPAAAASRAASFIYIVLPGDTLSRIAARFNTTIWAILAANPQITNPNRIYVGQRITIPTGTPPPSGATRISFATGATSALRTGNLAAYGMHQYVLKASAGQWMNVQVSSTGDQAIIIIYGQDGNVLISDHAGARSWQGQLPKTQDYHIDVKSGANATISYQLSVIIPQRVRFATGATSATLTGTTPVSQTHSYVLAARAGQTMTVNTSTTQGQVILVIWGADGNVLLTDHSGSTSFSGVLPTTEDYFVDVHSVGSASAVYHMTVSIH